MRKACLAIGALCIGGALPARCEAETMGVGCADVPKPVATIATNFSSRWSGVTSPDRVWRINGPWQGTGQNLLDPKMAKFTDAEGGALTLSVAPGEKRGAEIQSLEGYGYGYYETRMQVTDVPGVVASFFWIEAPGYGPHEWDVEFLTNEAWIGTPDRGQVHLTINPSHATFVLPLSFNPSKAFHRYGFLWTPGRIVFTVDGKEAHTFSENDIDSPAKGFIMMNSWTGNPDWGGGPPTQQAVTSYTCIRFTAGAMMLPPS